MLKNTVKEYIKRNLLFNPYADIHFKANESDVVDRANEAEAEVELEQKTNEVDDAAYMDIPNYLMPPRFKSSKPLMLCVFHIVPNKSSPFLLHLLHKKNELEFRHLPSFGGRHNRNLKQEAVNYIRDLFPSAEELSYVGFIETDKHNILFIKFVNDSTELYQLYSHDYSWATSHEVINLKKVADVPIAEIVTSFFTTHASLLVLKNDDDVIYNTPVIGYYTVSDRNDDIYKKNINGSFSSFSSSYYVFYFAMPPQQANAIIMRAALFLTSPSLNAIGDDVSSLIFNKTTPITYAIKHYHQHLPLSYII